MFINESDYKVVIGPAALSVITQADSDSRANAEAEAIEEISGYLRPVYDVEEIFAAEGDDRNRLLVMYTCDIALYHLSASLPQKMNAEVRQGRYQRAVKWLEGVQAGRIIPDLPRAKDAQGNPHGGSISYSSEPKLHHNW